MSMPELLNRSASYDPLRDTRRIPMKFIDQTVASFTQELALTILLMLVQKRMLSSSLVYATAKMIC